MHFSEIIKLQFGEKCHTLLCILLHSRMIVALLSHKNARYPQFSFWIPIAHTKICFYYIVINCVKIPLYEKAPSLTESKNVLEDLVRKGKVHSNNKLILNPRK